MSGHKGRRCVEQIGRNLDHKGLFGGFGRLSLPKLSTFTSGSVGSKDVLVGVAAGLAGSMLARWAVNNYLVGRVPEVVVKALNTPIVSGALSGAALYAAQRGSSRAKAHLVGATAAGAALSGWDLLQAQFPQLKDYVTASIPGGSLSGVIVRNPAQLQGVIVQDPRLADLQQMSIAGGDDDAP